MELLDIVDEKDEVIGNAPKREVWKKCLPHRIVHILIFDKRDRMALQFRSKDVVYRPHHWSTPVGGHVLSGETYEEAALREFEEELGTKTKIDFAYKDFFTDSRGFKIFMVTFKAVFEGPFKLNPKEVEKIEFFSLDEIKEMIARGEKFHPQLLFLLRKHFNI